MVPWFRDEINRPEIKIINDLLTHSVIHSCIIHASMPVIFSGLCWLLWNRSIRLHSWPRENPKGVKEKQRNTRQWSCSGWKVYRCFVSTRESRNLCLGQEALELGFEGKVGTCQTDKKGEVQSKQRTSERRRESQKVIGDLHLGTTRVLRLPQLTLALGLESIQS